MTSPSVFDVAVVGAGMAGLTCASTLMQTGYRVVMVEKSRGVGGRLATRRLHDTRVDHGTCYLSSPRSAAFQAFMEPAIAAGVVHQWTDRVAEVVAGVVNPPTERIPRYVAAAGMSAIAKTLTAGLEIRLSQRVDRITRTAANHWQLAIATAPDGTQFSDLLARVLVIAVPAPQARALLQPLAAQLPTDFMSRLAAMQFSACLSVMAGYTPDQQTDWWSQYPDLKAVTFADHPALGYVGADSSKRSQPTPPVFVVQSSAAFADRYLETPDLQPAAAELLTEAALLAPWFATPEWLQIHRWRYALPISPLPEPYLAAGAEMALVCTGDWCGGRTVEAAFRSGLATAAFVEQSHPL